MSSYAFSQQVSLPLPVAAYVGLCRLLAFVVACLHTVAPVAFLGALCAAGLVLAIVFWQVVLCGFTIAAFAVITYPRTGVR